MIRKYIDIKRETQMKKLPTLTATASPSKGPGRMLARLYWEEHGLNYDLVKEASMAKNKTEAAHHLNLAGVRRYRQLDSIYKAFSIKEKYSSKAKFAYRTYKTPLDEFNKALKEAGSREHYCPSTIN